MIKNFACNQAEKIFNREFSERLPLAIQRVATKKLWMINAAENINDLRVPPANHLEQLKGERKGQYSIRINERWRICFEWKDGNVYEVEIVDYH